jgi:hypothetical protein
MAAMSALAAIASPRPITTQRPPPDMPRPARARLRVLGGKG